MSLPFAQRRRQVFLTEAYLNAQAARRSKLRGNLEKQSEARQTSSEERSLFLATSANEAFEALTLLYTAGAVLPPLRFELLTVVEAYENYQMALGKYEGVPTMAPLGLGDIGDYERCLQLIGLCYLLHRRDLLPRIAAMIDPGYRGEDTLYEDLLSYSLPNRVDLDEWYHADPYTPLVQSIYEQEGPASAALLKQYCDSWYAAFKYVPWHDGHKRINGTEGDYFGYWAFEAGAVALLCEIDDSAIDHMVYPKDLVAWARQHQHLSAPDAGGDTTRLRCTGGDPCPQEGFWLTPAKSDSRRRFGLGEVMPELHGDWGTTVWQWDERPG